MTLISDRFNQLRAEGKCALIPFLTAGDPDLETTARALKTLDANGADFLELGVPYSDPLADGPVIQAAATRALARGIRLEPVLEMVTEVSPTLRSPLILFTYYNPILNRGISRFLDMAATAGVKGIVVPDLPLEEADELIAAAAARALDLILLIAPTSSAKRREAIALKSTGFIYLVSVTGVTGMRTSVESRVQNLLSQLREITDKPIGVGFGISAPQQARQMREWGADAAIVGSAFVKRLAAATPEEGIAAVGQLCRDLKAAMSLASYAKV